MTFVLLIHILVLMGAHLRSLYQHSSGSCCFRNIVTFVVNCLCRRFTATFWNMPYCTEYPLFDTK